MRDDNRAISAKRWVPPSTVRRDALSQNRDEIIFRRVRGILNKLTPEKFEKLSDDLLEVELNSDKILKGVIILVFEKALDEPKYSSMYARLCQRLCEEAPSANTKDGSLCSFRHLLLNSCKAVFDARTDSKIDKRKSLGNIKFIGELCKLGILSKVIMFECMKQLITKKNSLEEMADDLECLCQILRTCGQTLDSDAKASAYLDQFFDRMEVVCKTPGLPIRIKFMLRDIIELRKSRWTPRKATNTEGPLPINQIVDERGPSIRNNEQRPPQQELFPRQLKKRSGLDVVLSSSLSFPQHDKFSPSPYNSNGFQNSFRDRGSQRQNHHQQQNNHFYQQNRYNNQHNNNNSNNTNSKDIAPRFIKRIMTAHEQSAANLEQVSLRPPAHSMLFKPPNANPPSQFAGRTPGLLSNSNIKPNPPIQTTKEVPIVIKPAAIDKGKPKKEKTTKEEALKKSTTIAEDILSGGSLDEAVKSFSQLKVSDRLMPECLYSIISKSYEKTDNDRETVMSLLTAMKKEGVVNSNHFHETFRNMLKSLPDLESTVPNILSYFASFAKTAITEDLLTIAQLGELTEDGAHFPLLLLTLEQLSKEMEKQKLTDLFNESKVSLMNSLKESDRTKEKLTSVLEERGLVFLEPLLLLEGELWAALEEDPTASSLYKCAKENIPAAYQSTPPFVSALVTVCLRYITQESMGKGVINGTGQDKAVQEKEKALLERFKGVLQAFLHEDINLQVTAVYALQVFCHSLKFPKGMLLRWFVNLYDLEIVEEEAFLKWREDVTEIYPGKGNALFQVNNWLTWLAEAESEEEEEEED